MTGLGAISAAIVLDLVVNPAGAVFVSLATVFLLIAALVWATPETARSARARATSTMPRLTVPADIRHELMVTVPAIIAGWATNGLFLALGSSVVKSEFGATTNAQQSIIIPMFAVSGIIASVALRRSSARVISVYGTSALGIGTALSLAALTLHSLPAYLLAVAVMGSGFGTAFMGVLRTLMPHIDPAARAAVMAVMYTVSYLAFALPTIIAGLLVPVISLQGAMTVLGVATNVVCGRDREAHPHPRSRARRRPIRADTIINPSHHRRPTATARNFAAQSCAASAAPPVQERKELCLH